MKRSNRDVTIRYNVSQNDREGFYFYGFEDEAQAEGIHIYNNTHFMGKGREVRVFPEGRTPLNATFENNMFFFAGEGNWGTNDLGVNTTFRNNLYFNIKPHPSDSRPIECDPGCIQGGIGGTNIDLATMDALRGYRLRAGSPGIDTGIEIPQNGGQDLCGTRLGDGKADVEAIE